MIIRTFPFNTIDTNCYVVFDDHHPSHEALLIDPSCHTEEEFSRLYTYVEEQKLHIRHIVITHAHVDHVIGAAEVCRHYALPLTLHRAGEAMLGRAQEVAPNLHLNYRGVPELLTYVEEGDRLDCGGLSFRLVDCSGHAPGSLCLIEDSERVVFTGDVLFRDSIGRTDLSGGDLDLLLANIRSKLLTLDEDYTIRPGHGGRSDMGHEKTHNPFLIEL